MSTDVDNVANVDFLPNLSDCSLARVQVRVNLSRHFAFAAPCNPTQNFAGFLTFLCNFSRNSTPLVHPAKNKKPHNQAITRLSLYPEPVLNCQNIVNSFRKDLIYNCLYINIIN